MIGQETSAVLRDKHVIGGTSVVTLKPLEVRLTGMGHGSIDRECVDTVIRTSPSSMTADHAITVAQ